MPEEDLSNTQLVIEMMEYSAVAQLFIIEAIRRYADTVSQVDPHTLDGSFIRGQLWVDVAKEIRRKMQAHYGWD
ncbi:hypothetical protein AVMA1855_22595 [Acidovorax sp. SUPP1855]|uniref:hypothetical protein n=1 Tax=Acidovorax sp. SUPP1855 TaxID=431774 RepID=UPI0023DE4E23|nr:hypothetical protein [Acidovorax sp. SUPP1855]GKS86993.1 hypothetical protein AVMA1855_22595 [Acidovorax sp. SUPP1855]